MTNEDIIAAARHVLRPDATEYELEHDAPRVLSYAVRSGCDIRVSTNTIARVHPACYYGASNYARWWQEAAPFIDSIWIAGEQVL